MPRPQPPSPLPPSLGRAGHLSPEHFAFDLPQGLHASVPSAPDALSPSASPRSTAPFAFTLRVLSGSTGHPRGSRSLSASRLAAPRASRLSPLPATAEEPLARETWVCQALSSGRAAHMAPRPDGRSMKLNTLKLEEDASPASGAVENINRGGP